MAGFIKGEDRRTLLSIALHAATAANNEGVSLRGRRYAECAVALLRAAIGAPLTFAEAQRLLERLALFDSPLEGEVADAIFSFMRQRDDLAPALKKGS